jgi:AcrR family transcriptional regulator
MTETTRVLRVTARRFTAERGLSGFTVEELCDEAGISRRTFFNYFASKENAVLGIAAREDETDLLDAFVSGGERVPGTISTTLLEDLADLVAGRWHRLGMTSDEARSVRAAIEQEPKLMALMVANSDQTEADYVELIARREGIDRGDPRATATVHAMHGLAQATAIAHLRGEATGTFRDDLRARVAAARAVFTA